MGHGKETPRQKMIGMMYLVLTALLALNVSKDVLNAFVLVDEGMMKTIENFMEKNEAVYGRFDQQYAINPTKVGELYNQVQEVRKQSAELYKFIQDKKIEIIIKSEGKETKAVKDGEIYGIFINGKDNADIPAEIMMGDNNDRAGKELKNKMIEYREYVIKLTEGNKELVEALESGLFTDDEKAMKEGEAPHSWESAHFEHLPLMGVLTIMTGLQANIRNAESDVINYLLTEIDAGSFKFNKLEPVVIPNSNYILKGNQYDARVFLAAFDTTQKPKVYIGRYEEFLEGGETKYRMVGAYDSLTDFDASGKAIYKRGGGAIGNFKWGGVIKLRKSDGGYIEKAFQTEYQVAEGSVVVSPTKMNVFYTAVDNPVEISISGVPQNKIFPTISNGTITGPPYIVRPKRVGNCMLTVIAEIDGVRREMGSKEFRVKSVPDPVAKVAGKKAGAITKNTLVAQTGVQADMENFEFEFPVKVIEFTVSASMKGFLRNAQSKSNTFTQEQKDLIQALERNMKVYIEDIKAVGPDGIIRDLPTVTLLIN